MRLRSIAATVLSLLGFGMVAVGLFVFSQLASDSFRVVGLAALPLLIVAVVLSIGLFVIGNLLFLASVRLGGLAPRVLSAPMALTTGVAAVFLGVATLDILGEGRVETAAFGAVATLVVGVVALFYARAFLGLVRGR